MERDRMLIIKTGSAFAEARRRFGDFDAWFRRAIGSERFDFETRAVDAGASLPDFEALDGYAGIVITGSPAMVSDRLDWSERSAEWLAEVVDTDRLPVLGVCYGHQLLARALGGRVGPNPHGRRMGTCGLEAFRRSDPLFVDFGPEPKVHVTHLEAVLEPPAHAEPIARAAADPFHALRFGARCWGVQFHPEFDAAIMRCYVTARAGLLDAEGFDSAGILADVTETDDGSSVLQRFAACCRSARKAHAAQGA
jgi:GMP synthase (glutamine-hydrolysing)